MAAAYLSKKKKKRKWPLDNRKEIEGNIRCVTSILNVLRSCRLNHGNYNQHILFPSSITSLYYKVEGGVCVTSEVSWGAISQPSVLRKKA